MRVRLIKTDFGMAAMFPDILGISWWRLTGHGWTYSLFISRPISSRAGTGPGMRSSSQGRLFMHERAMKEAATAGVMQCQEVQETTEKVA